MLEHARSVAPAGDNLIVLTTSAGGAATTAAELDRAAWADVVGTVAGDDTIFIAVSGRRDRSF
jgi:transcriptional regulator of arginine metabolism